MSSVANLLAATANTSNTPHVQRGPLLTPEYFMDRDNFLRLLHIRLQRDKVTANKLRVQNNIKKMDSFIPINDYTQHNPDMPYLPTEIINYIITFKVEMETKDIHITKMTLLVREIPLACEYWWYDHNYCSSNHLWAIGWEWINDLPKDEHFDIKFPSGPMWK